MESSDANHTSENPRPKAIVCLYAQRDEPLYRKLQTYLVLWQHHGHIYWADPASIQQADLILLLLSPNFFTSRRCQTRMVQAFEARTERGIPVVPVLARASNWKESACGGLKALPDNDRPIAEWRQPERAYENICAGLAQLLPDLPALGIAPPERPRLFQARDLPKGYVPRPKAFNELKRLLLSHEETQKSTAITIALRGAGGFGKTTLALALCHDPEVQAAFPDGILWVQLSEQPRDLLDLLNRILHALEPSLSRSVTVEEAQERWRRALAERECLLVIDDVWQPSALEPLLEGGPHCKRLVTTRNDQVLPEEAARIQVDMMEPTEAIALLCQDLSDAIQQTAPQAKLEALVRRLGCWPILLTLAHGLIAERVRRGRMLEQAVEIIEQAYQDRGVTAFDVGRATTRHQAVQVSIEVSLRHIEEFLPARYQAKERYQELVVFPEDTNIPLTTLQIFWQATGHLKAWETEDLCLHLHRLSLLMDCDLEAGTIRLHDVLRSYLIQRAGPHLPALHGCLLDACQQEYGVTHWADLPQSEAYLWQHLILHLYQAGYQEALKTTLTNLSYLTRKALYVGVSALENDLLLANTWFLAQTGFPLVAELYRNIRYIHHLLRQTSTLAEMGSLLLSYLSEELVTADQRRALECELPRPFLTAWHPLPMSSALQRTLSGHSDSVNSCAVSPDGRFIVSASSDQTLKVWEVATGAERLTLSGHSDIVTGCAISPDGHFIVSASWDHTLKVWNAASGAERLTLRGHTSVVDSCAVSPDGRFIVSASRDHTLKVWDAVTGTWCFALTGHTAGVRGCAVSPDGRFIVSASTDKTLKVWDAATGAERLTLAGHAGWVHSCAVSPDGRFIVSASGYLGSSGDRTLKVWDAATGAERLTLAGHTARIWDCAVSPDSCFIVSASADKTLKVWDTPTGAGHFTLAGHSGSFSSCVVSSDSRFIVSTSGGSSNSPPDDHTLKVWNAATREERLTLIGHSDIVTGCAISPDGRFIVSASWDHTLKVWDTTSGEERLTLTSHTSVVDSCAVSPDGCFIISASWDHTLKVWDAATGAERRTLSGHTKEVESCAMSPDGRTIVSASADKTLKVWDATTGAEVHTLSSHTGAVFACGFSSDGQWIVSASHDKTLKVWDAASGAEHLTLTGHTGPVYGCAFSPDGRWIVSISNDKTLKVWDAATGQCLLTFPVNGPLRGCAFYPDGEHLVACGDQGMYFLQLVM